MGLFYVWFWLTAGGVLYQAFGPHDRIRVFSTAFDQATALLFVWLIGLIKTKLLFKKPRG